MNLFDDIPVHAHDEVFTDVLLRQGFVSSGSSRLVSQRRPINLIVRHMTNGCYCSGAWLAFGLKAELSAISVQAIMC
jgi:hypothetical protein